MIVNNHINKNCDPTFLKDNNDFYTKSMQGKKVFLSWIKFHHVNRPIRFDLDKNTSIVDHIHLKFDRIHEHLFRSNRQRNFQYFEKSQGHINV